MVGVDAHDCCAWIGQFLRLGIGAGRPAHVVPAQEGKHDLQGIAVGKGHTHVIEDSTGRLKGIFHCTSRGIGQHPLHHIVLLRFCHGIQICIYIQGVQIIRQST